MMEFTQTQRENLDNLASRINCTKDFKCYKLEPEEFCKGLDNGEDEYLDCFEEDPKNCEFLISSQGRHFCKCPLRIYIVEELM